MVFDRPCVALPEKCTPEDFVTTLVQTAALELPCARVNGMDSSSLLPSSEIVCPEPMTLPVSAIHKMALSPVAIILVRASAFPPCAIQTKNSTPVLATQSVPADNPDLLHAVAARSM